MTSIRPGCLLSWSRRVLSITIVIWKGPFGSKGYSSCSTVPPQVTIKPFVMSTQIDHRIQDFVARLALNHKCLTCSKNAKYSGRPTYKKRTCIRTVHSFISNLNLRGLGHAVLGHFVLFCYLWALNVKLAEQESFIFRITATQQLRMIFQLFKCHFDINWYKFEKKVGRRFSNLPKCNPFQSSPV